MGELFGTDGIRGVANRFLSGDLAYKTGRATATVLKNRGKNYILIGKDTRKSGDMLEAALAAGITSVGVNVVRLGVIPTPGVAYLTKKYGAKAGIVISASHNPGEYNGIKIFSYDGFKLPDEREAQIEKLILSEEDTMPFPIGQEIGISLPDEGKVQAYMNHLISKGIGSLEGMRIALDCGHGATYRIAPQVFEKLGADVVVINTEPDGMNINRNCGSTNVEIIKKLVHEVKADVGFAFDGDGDRVMAVDDTGNIMDGDHILAACGMALKAKNQLPKDGIVGTVMSNLGFVKFMEEHNLKFIAADVGDRYVLEELRRGGYSLGGEQSGHIIFLDHATTGDGILTAVQIVNTMLEQKKKLSEINRWMKSYPQVLINAEVKEENKKKYLENEKIVQAIEKINAYFDGRGRVLIRPSGTEPLIRVMIEGEDEELIANKAEELAKLIGRSIGLKEDMVDYKIIGDSCLDTNTANGRKSSEFLSSIQYFCRRKTL